MIVASVSSSACTESELPFTSFVETNTIAEPSGVKAICRYCAASPVPPSVGVKSARREGG